MFLANTGNGTEDNPLAQALSALTDNSSSIAKMVGVLVLFGALFGITEVVLRRRYMR